MKTHGMRYTKIYNVFCGIKGKCNNINHHAYKYYGARGIKCEWKNFEEFYKDMGNTYQEGLTLERKKNNLNYNKSNCKWATRKEQANNRRSNIIYKGKTLKQWCEQLGLKYITIYMKIYRGGKIDKVLGIE